MFSVKTKAILSCIFLFVIGGVSGYLLRDSDLLPRNKANYSFQYDFERLAPLTKELNLSDIQKSLLLNILADHKAKIDNIMKQVDPKIKVQLFLLRENIKGILDEQQKQQYDILLREHERKLTEDL